jgi:hypothetical protein
MLDGEAADQEATVDVLLDAVCNLARRATVLSAGRVTTGVA